MNHVLTGRVFITLRHTTQSVNLPHKDLEYVRGNLVCNRLLVTLRRILRNYYSSVLFKVEPAASDVMADLLSFESNVTWPSCDAR